MTSPVISPLLRSCIHRDSTLTHSHATPPQRALAKMVDTYTSPAQRAAFNAALAKRMCVRVQCMSVCLSVCARVSVCTQICMTYVCVVCVCVCVVGGGARMEVLVSYRRCMYRHLSDTIHSFNLAKENLDMRLDIKVARVHGLCVRG